jgi:prepilin-type N-terminal cleavage/methylation domain-containing protein
MNRNGFTLLEVLVASVLMGMLVTILTVIFNQSAIAWRTGKAGVADMSETERNLARIHAVADNVLPYTQKGNYFVVPPWNDAATDGSRSFYGRGIATAGDIRKGYDAVGGNFSGNDAGKSNWRQTGLGKARLENQSQFTVGVRSAGPDRRWDTEDDISTWPEEVE